MADTQETSEIETLISQPEDFDIHMAENGKELGEEVVDGGTIAGWETGVELEDTVGDERITSPFKRHDAVPQREA